MIPKIIHYCWFGRGQMPELAVKCIDSWKKNLPDYEIKEWNEDNFDLDICPYVREAYDNKKFAFVTDVVRLYALYTDGGIYMDTDVEVLMSFDEFLDASAFFGFEDGKNISTGIMGSEKQGKWAKDNLENYACRHFIKDDGSFDMTTNVVAITDSLLSFGLKQDNAYQVLSCSAVVYPQDYFSPKSVADGKIYLTCNSHAIHHFSASWQPAWRKYGRKLILLLGGPEAKNWVKRVLRLK
ncbi:glycosyltransferase family 32 protein [Bacteroides acidifaciens]|jgi:hypothetical protein|uniref:glycosyltransferase family 32 protein n=1 Tax=Bacteroides acidifaciens TaxID=85831 RepID=UPI00259BBED3|nr:glycosyltransferase [Bacteroides acidifaciens]